MRYILVVIHDDQIDHIQGFDSLKKAKLQADEEIGYCDPDQNPGDAVVFELNLETGVSNEVYRPDLPERDDDVEEDDIE